MRIAFGKEEINVNILGGGEKIGLIQREFVPIRVPTLKDPIRGPSSSIPLQDSLLLPDFFVEDVAVPNPDLDRELTKQKLSEASDPAVRRRLRRRLSQEDPLSELLVSAGGGGPRRHWRPLRWRSLEDETAPDRTALRQSVRRPEDRSYRRTAHNRRRRKPRARRRRRKHLREGRGRSSSRRHGTGFRSKRAATARKVSILALGADRGVSAGV